MEWESLRDPPKARKAANALAVVVGLAIVSLWLECKAEWRPDRIAASLFSFLIVGAAILIRFASRGHNGEETDELWITALWAWLVGGVARGIQTIAKLNDDRAVKAFPRKEQRLLPPPRDGGQG
jgi:hypothetical protein